MKLSQHAITKTINYLLVAYAFVTPVSRAGIVFFTALLLLLWIAEGGFGTKWQLLKNSRFIIVLTLFLLLNFASLLWSDAPAQGLLYIKKYWYLGVIPVIYTSAQKTFIPRMISAFLIGMLISEVISYGIFFEWWHFKNIPPQMPTPFMHHIHYSIFLAFTALLILNRIFLSEKRYWRVIYLVYFLFVTTNLFVNGGRTGQLAFIVALFVTALLHMRHKLRAVLLTFLLSFATLTLAYHYSPNFKLRVDDGRKDATAVFEQHNYCDSFGRRFAAWIVAGEIIAQHPLAGTGVSDAMSVMRARIRKSHPDMRCASNLPHFHNDFIQLAVQLGIPGMLLYLLLFYSLLTLKIRAREYQALTVIFVTVYTIGSLFETLFHQQFTLALFALFSALLLAVKRIENADAIH